MTKTYDSAYEVFFSCIDSKNKVMCSEEKNDNYSYEHGTVAFSAKFLQLNSDYHAQVLSVDVDNLSLNKINILLRKYKVPKPTFIITTDNGYHLHWVLENFVATKNFKAYGLFSAVQRALVHVTGGDVQAIGHHRVWRGLLGHDYTFSGQLYGLNDFKKLLKHTPKVSKYSRAMNVDFNNVHEGERHQTLFHAVRHYAYDISGESNTLERTEQYALEQNSKMHKPLPEKQVISMCKSVDNWVTNVYSRRLVTSGNTITEYNKELARKKSDKTKRAILDGIISALTHLNSLKNLRETSLNKMAKLIGVSRPSYAKYKDECLDFVLAGIKAYKKQFAHMIAHLDESFIRDLHKLLGEFNGNENMFTMSRANTS